MAVKIFAGIYKGQTISTPPESITRPTSIMLRRRIFDAYQDLRGYRFFDLCAGSGAMGYEAISRGADELFLLENNQKAITVIKKNSNLFKCSEKITIQKASGIDYLKKADLNDAILFFDPPYEQEKLYIDFCKVLLKNDTIPDMVWIESDQTKGPSLKKIEEWLSKEADKCYEQGTSFIATFSF